MVNFIKALKHNSQMLNTNKHIHWIVLKEDIIINIDIILLKKHLKMY